MEELRFDGRTAIVTGAGGNPSIGRAHALLLAARGANVVVNDIGGPSATTGHAGGASAERVAEEIRALGGNAVANTNSIATPDGAEALINQALEAFGKIDILINNAGIAIAAPLLDMTVRDFQRQIDVNLMGSVWTSQAALPHMAKQRYGRIVNTTSLAMTGFESHTAYGASKGGLWSFTRSLAEEGGPLGIKVNAVNPGAFSGLVAGLFEESSPLRQYAKENLQPELVSPVVAYLAHETCPVTGECIESSGGQVRRVCMAQTPGFLDRGLTIEMVANRWHEVMEGQAEVIAPGAVDTSQWAFKPYDAETRR